MSPATSAVSHIPVRTQIMSAATTATLLNTLKPKQISYFYRATKHKAHY